MRHGRPLLFSFLFVIAGCGPSEAPRQGAATPSESRSSGTTILYATKSGSTVSVRRLNLATKAEATILIYTEVSSAEHSGNMWDELPPSVASSFDGTRIAFAAADGLHVLDLKTGTRRTLVARTVAHKGDQPASWSPSLGTDAFAVFAPRWSGDGRFLSFIVSHYEGHSISFVDVADGRVFAQKGLPSLSYADPELGDLSWARSSASSVVPRNGTETGIFLSKVGDPAGAIFLQIRANRVTAAALAADARRIALTYESDVGAVGPEILAVTRRGETRIRVIDTDGPKSAPMFDAAGVLWWLERGSLKRWDESKTTTVGRVDPSYEWEITSIHDGRVSLVGKSADKRAARFLLLDTAGKQLAAYDSQTDYVTLLDLARSLTQTSGSYSYISSRTSESVFTRSQPVRDCDRLSSDVPLQIEGQAS